MRPPVIICAQKRSAGVARGLKDESTAKSKPTHTTRARRRAPPASGAALSLPEGSVFQSIVENISDGVAIIDSIGTIDFFSVVAELIFGYQRREVIGKNVSVLISGSDRALHGGFIDRYLETGEAHIIGRGRDLEGLTKDGIIIPVELGVTEMAVAGQRYFLGTLRDIAGRKTSKAALIRSERRLAHAQSISHFGSWKIDLASGSIAWSEETHRIFGFEPGAVQPSEEVFYSLVHPDDRVRVMENMKTVVITDTPSEVEYRVHRPDGTEVIVHSKREIVRDASGRPVRVVGTVHDITERKRAEEALRRSERSLAQAQRMAHLGSWEVHLMNGKTTWSDEAYRIFGYEPGDVDPDRLTAAAVEPG